MNPDILYEDDHILAVNKPPGVVVNNAASVTGMTIQDWAADRITRHDDDDAEYRDRNGVLHRLDKETSGVLLIAKDNSSFFRFKHLFMERLIRKEYVAVCHGSVRPPSGRIDAPVGRLPWNRERFGIVPEGKPAQTDYEVVSTRVIDGMEVSVVKLFPKTGRTHQIRVHMKYIGHPLVGDHQYAGRKTSRDDREKSGRVLLHAAAVRFMHPFTGSSVEIVVPMPDDMKGYLQE